MAENEEQTQEMLDLSSALQRVVKAALYKDNVARGLHEVCKSLENATKPVLCILADDCSEEMYLKLVKALCKENNVPLIHADEGLKVGEWVGLCKYDASMKPRKVRRCSSVVLRAFANEEDDAVKMVKEAIEGSKEITL